MNQSTHTKQSVVTNKKQVSQQSPTGTQVDAPKSGYENKTMISLSTISNADNVTIGKIRISKQYISMAVLSLVNIAIIIITFVLLSRLTLKAEEVKTARNTQIQISSGQNINTINTELNRNASKIELLDSHYPDESSIIDFVSQVDALKDQDIVSRFTFVSDIPVKDRLGYLALPIAFQIKGETEVIQNKLNTVHSMPYLLRTVTVRGTKAQESEVFTIEYGGVLYVKEPFENN